MLEDRGTIACTSAADGALWQWCVNSRREVTRNVRPPTSFRANMQKAKN